MTSRILKFTISPDSPTMIHLPRSSRVIMVAEQNTLVRFWVETPQQEEAIQAGSTFIDGILHKLMAEEEYRIVRRTFELVPTGATIDPTFMQHRGSVVMESGAWHLYERMQPQHQSTWQPAQPMTTQPTQQPPTGDPTP